MKICFNCMQEYDDSLEHCPGCGMSEFNDVDSLLLPRGTPLRDRYIVGGVIDCGSFGATYEGWDGTTEQRVAIKEYLPAEFATRVAGQLEISVFNDTKKRAQFQNGLVKFVEEGQKIREIQGVEGVVRIIDAFEENKTSYIIMEYLYGSTLSDILSNGAMPTQGDYDITIDFLLPMIGSLQTLHDNGICHLDISPDNIFVTREGAVKLIDFAAYRHVTATHSRSLSVLIKNPGYPPEELYRSAGDLGSHTDVYALGAVIYRMLTGITPPDAMERRKQLGLGKLDPLKPIRKLNSNVTKSQENAVLNALNVRIEDRTPYISQFVNELLSPKTKRHGQKVKILDIGKWPRWAKAVVSVGVAAIIAVVALIATGTIGFEPPDIVPEGMARVPSLVNSPLEQAARRVEAAGLQYMVAGKEFSGIIPADYVLLQDILAGSIVEENTMVMLTISGGAEMGLVPYVEGIAEQDAQSELEEAGFGVRLVYDYSRFVIEGNVVSQSAEGGKEFAIGDTIMLFISRGPDPESPDPYMSDVPNVIGLPYNEAVKAANEAGFAIFVSSRRYGTEIENTVVEQSLTANTRVMTDKPMGLVISLGVRMARVPDVKFREQAKAETLIKAAGFLVRVTTESNETVARGNVISQEPVGGSVIEYGSTVSIVVSSGGQPFKLISVSGETEADARSSLISLGVIVTVTYENSDTVAEGRVIRQSPSANTQATRGDTVTLVVSSGKVIVAIPNVVGDALNSAGDALRALKLKVDSSAREYSETVPEGNVISQMPPAGSSHPEGTTVSIVISRGREPITVPRVTGMNSKDAEAKLFAAGLQTTIREEHSDTVAKDSVISQDPSSGQLYRNDTVELVVSLGAEDVKVADVIGETRARAESILHNDGFKTEVINEKFSDTMPSGRVIAQNPAANTWVQKGSTVMLTISLGQAPPVFTSGNYASVINGIGGTHQVTTTSTVSVTYSLSGAPTGVTINSTSGLITISATTNVGSYNFTITANNGASSNASQAFTLIVESNHIAVERITGVPTSATVGTTLTLTGTVVPSTATNQDIIWSVQNARSTGADIISGYALNTTAAGTVTVRATIINGTSATKNYTEDFTITVNAAHVAVERITGVPTSTTAGVSFTLNGTVNPTTATNKDIIWSVENKGTTGADIISGNTLTTTAAGTVTIRATIINGTTATTDYIEEFTITVDSAHVAVDSITGVPTSTTAGTALTLSGTVNPTTATNRSIIWSVEDEGDTEARINGNSLTTTAAGTIIVRATIINGATETTDYIEYFFITVNAAVVAPSITSSNNTSVINGTGGTFQVTATGTMPINYSLSNQPEGVTINNTNGLITIDADTVTGTYSFIITASNNVSPNATQTFNLTVNEADG